MLKVENGMRILFIGDSITDIKFNKWQNKNIGGKKIYALQVADALKERYSGLKFFYKGIASNRSYHVYDRLTKDCIDLKPDIIFMLIGVNDAWENYVPEQYPPLLRPFEPHMKEIFRRIKAELSNTQLVVMLPFLINTIEEKKPFHKILDVYRNDLKDYAIGYANEIIDLQQKFDEEEKKVEPYKLAHDGVHPTEYGHSIICKAILEVIKK